MAVGDESFKKPGAIPFKWEIQPGVPKHHQPRPCFSSPKDTNPPPSPAPPPQPWILRSTSLHSVSNLNSECREHDPPLLTQPEFVSTGCFRASPWFRRRGWLKRLVSKPKKSVSTQNGVCPLCNSPSPSSFSFHSRSPSPWQGSDVESTRYGDF